MTETVEKKKFGWTAFMLIIITVGMVSSAGTAVSAYYRHQTAVAQLKAQSTHDAAELDVLRTLVEKYQQEHDDAGDADLDDVLAARGAVNI